ncbi:hypothetical protein MMC12_004146 [Toensbergia leucococca]|nr:hypothetical protein [Toensbergia leucococca]
MFSYVYFRAMFGTSVLFGHRTVWGIGIPRPDRVKNRCKIGFLTENAFRKHTTRRLIGFPTIRGRTPPLPVSYVRDLYWDMRDPSWNTRSWHLGANENWLKATLRLLLRQLRKLTCVRLEGALYMPTLLDLVRIETIRILKLRTYDYYFERDERGPSLNERWPIPLEELILDFRCLAELSGLHTLKLGRLVHGEGRNLAKGIARLSLIDLEISAIVCKTGTCYDQTFLVGGEDDPSPLVPFLQALVHRDDQNIEDMMGIQGSFPVTLRNLTLKDSYHCKVPLPEGLLWASLEPCQGLINLKVDFIAPKIVDDLLASLVSPALHRISIPGWRDTYSGTEAEYIRDCGWRRLKFRLGCIDPVNPNQYTHIIDSATSFVEKHQDSLQVLEITDCFSCSSNLIWDLNRCLQERFSAGDIAHRFAAQEVRISTKDFELERVIDAPLNFCIFGKSQEVFRWGAEIRRLRIDDIDRLDLEFDVNIESCYLQHLRVLDLRSYRSHAMSFNCTIPCFSGGIFRSGSLSRWAVRTEGTTMLGERLIGIDILVTKFPQIRLLSIYSGKFWVEHHEDGPRLWHLQEAFNNREQRGLMDLQLSKRDWDFIGEPSVWKERLEEHGPAMLQPIDHRSNTVLFLRLQEDS